MIFDIKGNSLKLLFPHFDMEFLAELPIHQRLQQRATYGQIVNTSNPKARYETTVNAVLLLLFSSFPDHPALANFVNMITVLCRR